MRLKRSAKRLLVLELLAGLALGVRGEVVLQYFETPWDEIYQRLPEIAEDGYEGIWTPPPSKSPVAGGQFASGGNVGYSGFDRFDIGDVPQRGSLATRYGTRGSLRGMVDAAHRCDIKIYPDIVFNHTGNGPDYRTYPGTRPQDFHGWNDGGQPGGYKRAPRMSNYGEINNGYGRTFQEELVSLMDLQLESDNRFSSASPNYAYPPSFYRQPGWSDRYPFGYNTNESTVAFMNRWINWLGYAMDYDGLRLDAPKHCIADFLGLPGSGFLHEAQWNFQNRRGYSTADEYSDLYKNYIKRKNALIFGEFFIGGVSEVDYWRNFGGQGVKLRYLDFPRKSGMIWPAFNNGDLAALNGFSGFSDAEGILFCQSHDESPPSKLELAYVYILTHVGLPVVYFTGNNLNGSDVNVKTWLKIGHGGALGDYNNGVIPNLVYINNNFARGREWTRWYEGDFFAYERYDDLNSNSSPEVNESLLLVGLNDSGSWQSRYVQTAFASGTVLHDYTGNNATDLTVDGNNKVNLSIPPGINGQGWVCYSPYNAPGSGDPLRFGNGGAPYGTMNWVVPGGSLATNKPRQVVRVTGNTVDVDVYPGAPSGGGVDSVMVKWGQGQRVNDSQFIETNNQSLVSCGYQSAVSNSGYWRLTATLTNVSEGLHLIKGRAFNNRPAGYPALFNTFTEAIYVDRTGPSLDVWPVEGSTVYGDCIALVTNADKTAALIDYSVDGGSYSSATEVMKGSWKFNLTGLSSGSHTVTVRAIEQDFGSPRANVNTSYVARAFTVNTIGPSVSLGFSEGQTINLPFFTTTISASGLNQSGVKLYWDGLQMANVTGTNTLTQVFDGQYVSGGAQDRLYGAFVNGTHFFEAVAVSGGVTNHATRRVVFNLYGSNQIDSDGDGIPDNVEMPNFSNGTAPGPNVPWPGDTSGSGNQDMIPNYGESWSRLNPMNANTFYGVQWDGDIDSDGDGFSNLCEVRQSFLEFGTVTNYDIYNSASHPGTCNSGPIAAQASWSPANPTRCSGNTLTVTYSPNGGVLSNASPILIHIGYNGWTNVIDPAMSSIGNGQWQYSYQIPTIGTQVDFVFHTLDSNVWDNNSGSDWHVAIGACVVITNYFAMDGQFDSANYEVASSGMRILAAVKASNLYVATWSPAGNASGSDHFLFITDKPGSSHPWPWAKAGNVYFDTATKPYISAESGADANGFKAFNNGGTGSRLAEGPGGSALEGEINLQQVFGYVPDTLYMAAVAVADSDGGGITSQCPALYGNNANDLESVEFLPVPVSSIRDENLDGVFDIGKPQMWTVVNGNTNDANYNLRRIFLDETMGDSLDITVILQPNAPGGTNVLSNVELFSNLNRRDFVVLPGDEDWSTITPSSVNSYYRAYPMTSIGGGRYSYTVKVSKCGAYRINARYKLNGNWVYYSDNGLRRDCAVVVTPKKALQLAMYEMNPMTVEATDSTFYGRSTFKDMYTANTNKPDIINPAHFTSLGANMIWLQPVHPIGNDNRQTDPETNQSYDPGSPYAVRNYWKVRSVLGDPSTEDQAMTEFTNFVAQMDAVGVGVMLDGTFNHSAWDCEIGDVGVQMFPGITTNPTALIRDVRPQWYSKNSDYGKPASYYNTANDTDIGVAPDRTDFGKWSDVADFFFGTYDTLVTSQTDESRDNFLMERDRFDGFATNATKELWQYFAQYPIYWLEKTGCPAGTPKNQTYKGIDGLRCDFAQGLPSLFWEYCINKTRNVKWDFIFMAESLDGNRTVNNDPRHGLSFRSARHFDVLNENMVFYWRDSFFGYPANGSGSGSAGNRTTGPTYTAFDNRKNAYDNVPVLLNLTSHDEVLPSDDPYQVLYAYAECGAMDGIPLIFYGQEAGLQNSKDNYGFTGNIANYDHNFAKYEVNFGKGIANFKRYNCMTNVWTHRDWNLQNFYGRINNARKNSTALKSQKNYFLNKQTGGGMDNNIFAVAKFTAAGESAATQEVVFAFANNNPSANPTVAQTYTVNTNYNGANYFGIIAGHTYNVVDLIATNPTTYIWGASGIAGSTLLASGIYVGLPYQGQQAQYLKLIDQTVNTNLLPDADGDGIENYADPDDDNDTLPDWWEIQYGLNPLSATGNNGANGDPDGDGVPNWLEYLQGTNPNDGTSVMKITGLTQNNGQNLVNWRSIADKNYRVQKSTGLLDSTWQDIYFGTALDTNTVVADPTASASNLFYRVRLDP